MVNVVGVRFKSVGKIYYFDPENIEIKKGDSVIVETSRGVEFGSVVLANKEISENEIVSPLKKVLRKATDDDIKIKLDNKEKEQPA